MSEAVDALEHLSEDPEAQRAARKRVEDAKFLQMRFALGREDGRNEGLAEGLAQGRVEGRAAILLQLLELRFGPLDADTEERLQSASLSDLERWTERILSAEFVAEVFAE